MEWMFLQRQPKQAMQSVFNEDADNLAKTTGFIKCERKITGSKFIKTLLFAGLQKLCPSVEACTRSGFSQQLYISAQGLDKRFTKTSCEFVKCVLERALSKTLCAKKTFRCRYLKLIQCDIHK